MFVKAQLLDLQAAIQEFHLDGTVVVSDDTCLLAYGMLDSAVEVHFDVNATLFQAIVAATGITVGGHALHREAQYSHGVFIHEGVYAGKTKVDELYVYDLENLRVRLERRGRKNLKACIAAESGAKFQAELAAPAPVAPVPAGPTWGELNEAEQAYELRCQKADWYYGFSDYLPAYKAGKADCEALEAEAKKQGGNYALLYKHYSSK